MKLSISPLIIALAAFLTTGASAEEKEPTAIVELGAGVSWDFPGGGSVGPTLGVEFTPIKDWLEIELGTGPFFGGGSTQWSTDALFKKPFTLSDTVEFMIGAGPEWWWQQIRRRARCGFYVLAVARPKVWLVLGAFIQLRWPARSVPRHRRGFPYCCSLNFKICVKEKRPPTRRSYRRAHF
jgi:hypothetical protein